MVHLGCRLDYLALEAPFTQRILCELGKTQALPLRGCIEPAIFCGFC